MRKGMSLVEILVTIAIIGGAVAVFAILLNVLRINRAGTLNTSAYKLAQEALNAATTLPLSDLDVQTNGPFKNIFYNNGTAVAIEASNAPSSPNVLELTSVSTTLSRVLIPQNSWTDFTLEANVLASSTMAETGLIVRGVDFNNYYFFYIDSDGIVLEKKEGGVISTLYQNLQSFNPDTWYKLKVVTTGSNLALYLNDVLLTTVVDSSFTSGYNALASYNNISWFDDVTTTELSTTYLWDFDDLSLNKNYDEWGRFGLYDLNQGGGSLSISEPYGSSDIKKLDVTIRWTEKENERSVNLSTLKTE